MNNPIMILVGLFLFKKLTMKILKPKNWNYSIPLSFPKLFTLSRKFSIEIKSDDNLHYTYKEKSDQIRVNKLFGLSDNFHHHLDSVRIGYYYYENYIHIVMYKYCNKKHYTELLYKYKNEKNDFHLKLDLYIEKDYYRIKNQYVDLLSVRTSKFPLFFPRKFLYPFFGNDESKPKITIKRNLLFFIKVNKIK